MRIRPQAYYDTLVRIFVLVLAGIVGASVGQALDFPYAQMAGGIIGVAVTLCFWSRISYSRMRELSEDN